MFFSFSVLRMEVRGQLWRAERREEWAVLGRCGLTGVGVRGWLWVELEDVATSPPYLPSPEFRAPGKRDGVWMLDPRGALEPGGCSSDLFQRWGEEWGRRGSCSVVGVVVVVAGRGEGGERWNGGMVGQGSGKWGKVGEGSWVLTPLSSH